MYHIYILLQVFIQYIRIIHHLCVEEEIFMIILNAIINILSFILAIFFIVAIIVVIATFIAGFIYVVSNTIRDLVGF